MKAVITVIGKDQVGIIAAVSAKCADFGANILEITQSVLDIRCMHEDIFASMHTI